MAEPAYRLNEHVARRKSRDFATPPVAGLIGNTPLIELTSVTRHLPPTVKVLAKAEWKNPGGSVKDRAAWYIIKDAIRQRRLEEGMRVLDASSGNTGIAMAMIGAALGVGVTICMPENATRERKALLRAYGAEVILTDPLEGTDGSREMARELIVKYPAQYLYVDQYANPANVRAHIETTGPEIWRQTQGRITHFVAGLGTTGTFMGVSTFLKNMNPGVRAATYEPEGPMHGIEGVKHMPTTGHVPEIFDDSKVEALVDTSTDEAYLMMKRLVREEGLLVGVSAAAAAVAALKVAETLDYGVVVTVFPDGADRYLSIPVWEAV
jgi:cysteine synthase B